METWMITGYRSSLIEVNRLASDIEKPAAARSCDDKHRDTNSLTKHQFSFMIYV